MANLRRRQVKDKRCTSAAEDARNMPRARNNGVRLQKSHKYAVRRPEAETSD